MPKYFTKIQIWNKIHKTVQNGFFEVVNFVATTRRVFDRNFFRVMQEDSTPAEKSFEYKNFLSFRAYFFSGIYFTPLKSLMLHYENGRNKDASQRDYNDFFIKTYRTIYVGVDKMDFLNEKVADIIKIGIKIKDAYHIASAILANSDYFITVDKKLFRFNSGDIKILSPIEFLKILEG